MKLKMNYVKLKNKVEKVTLKAFKSGIFPLKLTQGKGHPLDLAMCLKILSPN